MTNVFEIQVSDPELVVLEFSGFGEGVITKEAYDQRYISVIRLRARLIVHYKDYWNPIALVRAIKGAMALKEMTLI